MNRIAIDLAYCEACSAPSGARCTTTSGAVAIRPHAARTRAAEAAWHVGNEAGIRFAVSLIEARCDPDKADLDPRASLEKCLDILRRWSARTPTLGGTS